VKIALVGVNELEKTCQGKKEMKTKLKMIVGMVLATTGIFLTTDLSRAEGYQPSNEGGNFGLGFEVGDPGSWGVSGKLWLDRTSAFQPAVKLGNNEAILQLDYLWHNFNLSDQTPFYIGIGGNLLIQNPIVFGGRIPVGISHLFDKRNFPVDIYLQAVPTLWFFTAGLTTFDVYGELGAHIYL